MVTAASERGPQSDVMMSLGASGLRLAFALASQYPAEDVERDYELPRFQNNNVTDKPDRVRRKDSKHRREHLDAWLSVDVMSTEPRPSLFKLSTHPETLWHNMTM